MARRPRAADLELWNSVTRTFDKLNPRLADPSAKVLDVPSPKPAPPVQDRRVIPAFKIGQKARSTATVMPTPAVAPPTMDAKAYSKLKRGRLAPEARIDLHGMVVSEAHPELIRFIMGAQGRALRLVLVITGKGRGGGREAFTEKGVLRRQVPMWLRQAPLAPMVIEVTESHARHGGSGAFYVYLRRTR